jgi:ElaB/YqjD/DUF883 family membrane-anchored ribosome-binding protein
MKSAIEEPDRASTECAATSIRREVKETAQRVEKGVSDAKAAVSEKLDDGIVAARRLLKRSRYTVEDGLEEAAHNIKQHPFSSLAIGFAAGAALGLLIPRLGKK